MANRRLLHKEFGNDIAAFGAAMEDYAKTYGFIGPDESLELRLLVRSTAPKKTRAEPKPKKKKRVRRAVSGLPLAESDWEAIANLEALSPWQKSVIAFFRGRNNEPATEKEANEALGSPAEGPKRFSLSSAGSLNAVFRRTGMPYAVFVVGREWHRGEEARPYKLHLLAPAEKAEKQKNLFG